MRLYGKVIDHELVSQKKYDSALKVSKDLWAAEYPNKVFDFTTLTTPDDQSGTFISSITYNLEAAVSRQKVFYYQVSLPHYTYGPFVNSCVERYRKFLHLRRTYPKHFIVPCFDQDITWHTHMQFPAIYAKDTETICGTLFNHDDTVNERTSGSKLDTSTADTRVLWKETFNEAYESFGCMYRGEPTNGKMTKIDHSLLFKHATKLVSFRVTHISLDLLDAKKKKIKSLKIHALLHDGDDINILSVGSPNDSNNWTPRDCGEMTYEVDSRYSCNLRFEITKKSGIVKTLTSGKQKAYSDVHLDNFIGKCSETNVVTESAIGVPMSDGTMLKLDQSLVIIATADIRMRVVAGAYKEIDVPIEETEKFWGPVAVSNTSRSQQVSFADNRYRRRYFG